MRLIVALCTFVVLCCKFAGKRAACNLDTIVAIRFEEHWEDVQGCFDHIAVRFSYSILDPVVRGMGGLDAMMALLASDNTDFTNSADIAKVTLAAEPLHKWWGEMTDAMVRRCSLQIGEAIVASLQCTAVFRRSWQP